MNEIRFYKKMLPVTVFVILLCYSGCITNPNINNNTSKKDTLTWGVLSADSIDPLKITNNNYWTIIPNIYNSLVEYDEQFRIIPALAILWNNPDSLTWRFYLRQGVKFHNGNQFTAADVKYSIENFHPGLNSLIEDILIIDNYTIEIKTFEPTPILLERFAHIGIIYCKNVTGDPESQELIGTGPYRLADYELDNYTKLERFEEYWGEFPEIKTVVFKVIENDAERLVALRSGTIDIAEYNVDDKIDQILQDKNIKFVKYPPLSTYIIGFDFRENGSYGYPDGKNPTADVRVRQAIYQAINITPLIKGPFKGLATPTSQLVTPYIFGYNPEIERLPYNITVSKQLLTDAGYAEGFDIDLDCITEGFEYNAENCYLIKQQLSKIGVHVTMNNLSMNEYNQKVVREKNTSMYLFGWGEISMDGGWVYDLFIRSVDDSLGTYNSGYYSNAEVDRLGVAASHEMNPEIRKHLLQQGFRIALEDDIIVVPLLSQVLFTLTAKNVVFIPRADLRVVVKDIKFS